MLSTKDVKIGGSGSKTIEPGNQLCKINSITLNEFRLKEGGLEIILNMETKPVGEGFEGFFIDPQDQSRGRHLGQVGKVKMSQWAYADGKTKTGIEIKRDRTMMQDLLRLCTALGPKAVAWFDDADGKHATIQSMFEAFNIDRPFNGIYLNFCIAGKEYVNKQNFTSYDLFLPKSTKTNYPYEAENAKPSRIIVFSPSEHVIVKKSEEVNSFTGDENTAGDPASDLVTGNTGNEKQEFEL
jgi:hypothetical protein